MRLVLLVKRLGFRGGTLPGTGVNWRVSSPTDSREAAGDTGLEMMDEGCKWTGSLSRRLSTRISSVCTATDLDSVVDRMATWQPKSLNNWGSRGSRGVVGRLVGGMMLMLGICI